MLASDLRQAERALHGAGRTLAHRRHPESGREVLLVLPDAHDGFQFAIEERSLDDWLHERALLTGETLVAGT
jgi:hypothetical protein